MKKYFLFVFCLFYQSIFAQNTIEEQKLMVYKPTKHSIAINKAYTNNMFFGLFGIKNLINALEINTSKIKTITIRNKEDKKIVYQAHYDLKNNITNLELTKEISSPLKVNYFYKEDVLEKEIIINKDSKSNNEKINYFYYEDNKMYVKNANKLFDVLWLENNILLKNTYLDQKLGFQDRITDNCRITNSLGRDINKICFNNTKLELPLKVIEYIPEIETKTGKVNLMQGTSSEIKLKEPNQFLISKNNQALFEIVLDKNKRIKEFKFLGNKLEKQGALNFIFTYTFYKI